MRKKWNHHEAALCLSGNCIHSSFHSILYSVIKEKTTIFGLCPSVSPTADLSKICLYQYNRRPHIFPFFPNSLNLRLPCKQTPIKKFCVAFSRSTSGTGLLKVTSLKACSTLLSIPSTNYFFRSHFLWPIPVLFFPCILASLRWWLYQYAFTVWPLWVCSGF